MKNNTKLFMTFIGGVATGALISFALIKEKYEKGAEEEIKAMKEYYTKEFDEIHEEHEKELEELDSLLAEGHYELATHKREDKKNYVDYVKKYSPNELVEDKYYDMPYPIENDEDYEEPDVNDIRYEEPFQITREAFEEDYSHFDKLTITYYQDDVLADEQGVVIMNVEEVVGIENLENFGIEPDDPFVIYIRNGKLGTDYEVLLDNSTYAKEVLGFEEGDK